MRSRLAQLRTDMTWAMALLIAALVLVIGGTLAQLPHPTPPTEVSPHDS